MPAPARMAVAELRHGDRGTAPIGRQAYRGGVEISAAQALGWRLRRHHLAERDSTAGPAEVAGRLCGLHAQVMSSAELSLLARMEPLPSGAVAAALWRDRTLVKMWAARGTLYLLPAAELGMWLGALATLAKFGNNGNADTERICAAVGPALRDAVLTREELALAVQRHTGSARLADWVRSSWGSDLKAASFRGLLCFARPDGGAARFTAPESWIGAIPRLPPGDARRELARRFLGAYAPATPESIARWWVGPPRVTAGRSLIESLGQEAVPVTFAGRTAWVLASDLDDMRRASVEPSYRLLPAFDPWVIGAAREEPFMPPEHLPRIFRPQGWISPVVLAGGRVAGRWEHRVTARACRVTIVAFEPLPRPPLIAEAERIAAHVDRPLELSWDAP